MYLREIINYRTLLESIALSSDLRDSKRMKRWGLYFWPFSINPIIFLRRSLCTFLVLYIYNVLPRRAVTFQHSQMCVQKSSFVPNDLSFKNSSLEINAYYKHYIIGIWNDFFSTLISNRWVHYIDVFFKQTLSFNSK